MAPLSFLDSVIILGALQGFIIGIILFRSSKQKPGATMLASLLFIFALACLKIYLDQTSLLTSQVGRFVDALVPFFIIMPVGPLIYFYCKTQLQPGFQIQRHDHRHFFPVIIDLFHHISALVLIVALLLGFISRPGNFGTWFDTYNVYSDIPRWISLTIYLIFSYRLLDKSKKRNPTIPKATWLKEFLWVFIVFDLIWLAHLLPYVIPKYTDVVLNTVGWYPVYIPLVAIVYWLGIRGMKEMWLTKTNGALSMPEPLLDELMEKIGKAMATDKLYLDANLTITRLAQHVGSSPKVISAVLNQRLEKGFNEYINQFRIEEVKSRLAMDENKRYTIASIAYDCGFNSQPTFQRAFKSLVGMTPREFIHQNNGRVETISYKTK